MLRNDRRFYLRAFPLLEWIASFETMDRFVASLWQTLSRQDLVEWVQLQPMYLLKFFFKAVNATECITLKNDL